MKGTIVHSGLLSVALLLCSPALAQTSSTAPGIDDPIAYAESAGIPEIAAEATILDAEGNVLRKGSNDWTCMAIPNMPMCLDPQWMAFISALMSGNEDIEVKSVGLAYMLRGDAGASNIDPNATGPTPDNDWVVTGPHIMVIGPGSSPFAGMPTEPSEAGPYVMWAGTPFAHVMAPVVGNAVNMPAKK